MNPAPRAKDLVIGNMLFRAGGIPALQIFAFGRYQDASSEEAETLRKWLEESAQQMKEDEAGWQKRFEDYGER